MKVTGILDKAKSFIQKIGEWTQKNFRESFIGSAVVYVAADFFAHATAGSNWVYLFVTLETFAGVMLLTTIFFGVAHILNRLTTIKPVESSKAA